jgi:hypothetical protein
VIFKLLFIAVPITVSCQSTTVGSIVEKSKAMRPSWVSRVSVWEDGTDLFCVVKYKSKQDLPKSIKDAQIAAKLSCDNSVSAYYLEKNKSLSYKYTEKNISDNLQNCSGKCSEINDMYYEKVVESTNLYSYDVYIKIAYPLTYKIYR